jgi:thioredoxin 1
MSVLNIKIIGANCNKCNTLSLRIQKIIAENKLNAVVEKITDIQLITDYNIYTIPALLINNQLVSKGCLLSEKQIIERVNKFLEEDKKIVTNYSSTKKTNRFALIFGLLLSIAIILFQLFKYNYPDKTNSIIKQSDFTNFTMADSVLLLYDYSKQNTTFELSFLEFGSTGCRECKMMEKVIAEVKGNFANRINVVFYNVTKKENKRISKYFGIQMIPVQILLNKSGKEVFRHIGYYSYNELCIEFSKLGIN